jgi:hypothetical protein
MKHDDFRVGEDFWCSTVRWRCTDIGRRTIAAICLDRHDVVDNFSRPNRRASISPASPANWFEGPPYAVREHVFDEDTFLDCSTAPDEPIILHLQSLNTKVELPATLTASIWSGVRRGEITNIQEYVGDLLMRALDKQAATTACRS